MRQAAILFFPLLLVASSLAHAQTIQVGDLRCEYLKDPMGVDAVGRPVHPGRG